ncbi:MAG: potassium-transporting ATPase subunit KdpC [Alphaproteobacteria bacterium]
MLKQIRPAIAFTLLMTLLTGILYPFAMTGVSQMLFPHQANGSLIKQNGKVIGSSLIGQNFTSDKYFHSRPSATTTADPNDATKTIPAPYNAANSGGSNLGPTSQSLIDGVKATAQQLHAENAAPIPVDLVTASGSGLDPDITPAAAQFQIPRIAKSRNMPEAKVASLLDQLTQPRTFGILGEPTVNVLKINLALDNMEQGAQ